MYPTMTRRRELLALVAVLALFLSLLAAFQPSATLAAEPGENGHPTNGPYSDLKDGSATFTFKANATLTCSSGNVSTFAMQLDYTADGPLPAGATIVVYLSPNNGAINGNAGGDADGYVALVESNYTVVSVAGLDGTGTLPVNLNVSHPFPAVTGGILGVIANEADGTIVSNSKTNSLNCGEAGSTSTPTPTPEGSEAGSTNTPTPTPAGTVTPTPTPEGSEAGSTNTPTPTATATPEGSQQGSTGTPAPSRTPEGDVAAATGTPAGGNLPNTASGTPLTTPLVAFGFGLLLLGSIGTLAYANVAANRRRR